MFNIGFSEILVVALVSVIVLDKDKIPLFVDFVKAVYKYVVSIKLKIKGLLRDAGIEDLYKECDTEEVNYIIGKNGKLYPTYSIDSTSKRPISKNRPIAEPVYDEKFLGEMQTSTAEYSDVFEERRQALTTKLPSEIELCKRSNDSEDSSSR